MSTAHKPKLPINIVPERVAPGAIIDDRYCVVSPFVASSQAWVIDATDLSRVFGRPPNHRVGLHKVTSDHAQEHRLRIGLRSDQEVQPKFRELRHLFDGLLVVADHVEGEKLPPVLRSSDAHAVAEAASHLLARLHGAGIRGVRFSREQFVLHEGKAYLKSYAHLETPGSLRSDLDSFHEFLGMLSTAVHGRLTPRPRTAMEYSQRFTTASESFTWSDILPPIASYVTPHAVVETVFERFIEARQGHTREVRVTGPRGYGKTRLLHELAAEFTHQGEAIVVLAEAPERGGAAHNVVQRIFGQLTDYCATLPAHVANGLRGQVARAIDGFEGVIATALPRFGVWLGVEPGTKAPQIDIGESFARQANVLATVLRTICSQRRPLVLLVDNAEAMDVASIALLEELRRGDEGHILIVVAFLNSLQLETQPHSQHRLPSFREEQVREFLERSLPGEIDDPVAMAAHLYTTTAGRPLNCWAVLQDWVADGTISRRAGGWTLTRELGTDVIEAERLFEARVLNLSDDAFRLVLCYALSDTLLTREQLAAVLDWSDGRVSTAVRDGIRNAVIQSIEGHLSFNHGTVSDLLIARAGPDTKTGLHHRLADWIEHTRPENVVALAYHRECSSREGGHEELARLHLAAARKCLDVFDAGRAKWFAQHAKARSSSSALELSCSIVLAEALALCREQEPCVAEYRSAIQLAELEADRLILAESSSRSLVGRFGSSVALSVVLAALKRTRFRIPASRLGLLLRVLWELLCGGRPIKKPVDQPLAESFAAICARLGPVLVTEPLYMFVFLLRGNRLQLTQKTLAGPVVQAYWSAVLLAMKRRSRALLGFRQSLVDADDCGDPWVMGVARHVRAHCVDLPLGRYQEGQRHLGEAIHYFERSGDMSIGALSHMFRCLYGRDFESPADIADWAERGRAAADRQHNRMGEWPCKAFRFLADVRLGKRDRSRGEEIVEGVLNDESVLEADRFISLVIVSEASLLLADQDRALRSITVAQNLKPSGPRLDFFFETLVVQFKIGLRAADGAAGLIEVANAFQSRFAKLEEDFPRFGIWRATCDQISMGTPLEQIAHDSLPSELVSNFRSSLSFFRRTPHG